MYGIAVSVPVPYGRLFFLFAFEHLQHPVGYHKTAHHIECAEYYGNKTKDERKVIFGLRLTHYDDGTDDDHTVDRIGAAHQRGVQYSGYPPDHFYAEKDHEDNDIDKLLVSGDPVKNLLHGLIILLGRAHRQLTGGETFGFIVYKFTPMRNTTAFDNIVCKIEVELSFRRGDQW